MERPHNIIYSQHPLELTKNRSASEEAIQCLVIWGHLKKLESAYVLITSQKNI
jgi:hypothetical protein